MSQSDNTPKQKRMILEPRPIKELKGITFRIPFYQRGYRWEALQVRQLLEDLAESPEKTSYYLQPIVVAPAPSGNDAEKSYDYDIIDGQQRLTTIYLILQALTDVEPDFTITYQTRTSSRDFLNDITAIDDKKPIITESPDHLYMWHAYNTIKDWIKESPNQSAVHIATIITDWVKVIWYELPDSVTDWKKFTDLNIGKIPLTNSELIKALFLRSSNFSGENEKQSEEYDKQTLVAQWDQMERELSDRDFWGFLTRESAKNYPTKIDLIFDLISGKSLAKSNDKLFTFNYFAEWFVQNPEITGKSKWDEIYLQYQRIRDWYRNTDIYHLLGYLIAMDFPRNALQKVFRYAHPVRPCSQGQSGRSYRSNCRIINILNELVKRSLTIPGSDPKFKDVESFEDLRYNCAEDPDSNMDNAHHDMIRRYLTLYNIRTTEEAGQNLRYPFSMHNSVSGGWSLEHIHAQHSEILNKYNDWKEWIENHRESLMRVLKSIEFREDVDNTLKDDIENLIDEMSGFNKSDTRERFNILVNKHRSIMERMPGAQGLYQDKMANMALLGKDDNASLNNSTFDVKRQKIMSMLGTNYVPIATERAFLKAIYVSSEDSDGNPVKYQCDTEHLFFWSDDDRNAYIEDMKIKLEKFL